MSLLQNKVVVAGAGTGKTYTLVKTYLERLLGADYDEGLLHPGQILCVTFTEKAALEMRIRVMSEIQELMQGEPGSYEILARVSEANQKKLRNGGFFKIYRALRSAPICTFHAYCAQLLREHCLLAGMSPEFELLAPQLETDLLEQVAEDMVLNDLKNPGEGLMALVPRMQLKRFGGAKGLLDNIVSMHREGRESGVRYEVLPIFGADSNLDSRWSALAAAFETFAQNGITTPKAKEKIELAWPAFRRLKEAFFDKESEREIKLSAAFKAFNESVSGSFGKRDLMKALKEAKLALGQGLTDQFCLPESSAFLSLLSKFDALAAKEKDRLNAYGFSDLLWRARALLWGNLFVRKQVKTRFKSVLVDEFQDTSPIQEDLVALIAERLGSETKLDSSVRVLDQVNLEPGKLFIVGDPKQSIYGFRGADVSLFDHTLHTICHGNDAGEGSGVRESLTVNRRSQSGVLELVNLVSEATLAEGNHGVAFETQDHLQALDTTDGATAGARWVVKAEERLELESAKEDTLLRGLKTLFEQGKQPGDIAILVRRLKEASVIYRSLSKAGIPANIVGGEGFYTRPEVRDFLIFFRALLSPGCGQYFLALLRSPFVALSDAEILEVFAKTPEGHAAFSLSCLRQGNMHPRLGQFLKIYDCAFGALFSQGVGAAFDVLFSQSTYQQYLTYTEDGDLSYANIVKLRALMSSEKGDPGTVLHRYFSFMDAKVKERLADSLKKDDDGKGIQIMTIHQSKGLEFPVVVLADTLSISPPQTDEVSMDKDVGLSISHRGRPATVFAPSSSPDKKAFPTGIDRIRINKKSRVDAELARLLYVAMTRAKEALYIIDYEDHLVPKAGLSLRKLLHNARKQNPEKFDALLPIG